MNLTDSHFSSGINYNQVGLVLNSVDSNININGSSFQELNSVSASAILHKSSFEEMVVYNLSIISSNFSDCYARDKGGFISSDSSNMLIRQSNLQNGKAEQIGGAIYLKCSRSSSLNNYFTNNKAIYGNDIASYSYKLKILNTDISFLRNLASGGLLKANSLKLGLFDQDEQLVNLDNSSSLQLSSGSESLSIKAFTLNGINQERIKLFEPRFDSTLIIDIKFRECLTGEVLIQNKCQFCTRGTYSLSINDITCNSCPAKMRCDGGSVIQVDKNYWRSSQNTTTIFQCPKVGVCQQVCQSFNFSEEATTQSAFQGIKENCALSAPNILMEITMLEVVSMLTHQKAQQKQSLNPFDAHPYKLLLDSNDEYFSIGGQGFSQVLSFECFLKSSGLDSTIKQVYLFVILNGILPIILSNSFSLFSCVQMDDGKQYLRSDMSIECWTQEHKNFSLPISLPFILVWAICFPVFITLQLMRNRKSLSEAKLIKQYGLFYSGLNDKNFYWELAYVNGKKLIFISFSSVLSTFDPFYRISILIGGIIFIDTDSDKNENFQVAMLVFILASNILFVSYWMSCFLRIIIKNNIAFIKKRLGIMKFYKTKNNTELKQLHALRANEKQGKQKVKVKIGNMSYKDLYDQQQNNGNFHQSQYEQLNDLSSTTVRDYQQSIDHPTTIGNKIQSVRELNTFEVTNYH
ncbi:UNKNOWN [Stylonychia lemnae]|uniref:Transmembrane protein n=1 Tax=Stylonychia lemnae TaxID=5949 RepID=A0A078B8G6_STYLE|nr:UNKNOWN [Stylonychia lemnae]|eukprot:CDW89848.1 UNKNOWN [Stylonychia lemnae]